MIPIIRLDKDQQQANEMTKDFLTSFQKGFYEVLFLTNLMIPFLHDLEKTLFWFRNFGNKIMKIQNQLRKILNLKLNKIK